MTASLPRGLIVSCQARADNPLHGPQFMGAMALAARDGGAVAIRANGPDDIVAVKAAGLPVIGIHKIFSDFPVYITPSFAAAEAVVAAGADIVGLDCTARPREGGPAGPLIARIRDQLGVPVFADVSDLDEARAAQDSGASYIATTLSGYTAATQSLGKEPDLDLVEKLAACLSIPVIAEGRFNKPALVRKAFAAGAHAVVVGTMITNPREITRQFVSHGVPA